MNTAIRVENLTKTYSVFSKRRLLAAQPWLLLTRNIKGDRLYALQDVSFDVGKGEVFGIIGHNGSGKSTLLKIMSGITRADNGSVEIDGRVTSLLELGVGFEPEMTGRENIQLYGALAGLPKHIIRAKEESIIRFSGIRDFIDTQIKAYSSGMLIRLAFAAAIHTEPDVLLLDEVLGVGDSEFQHKSFQAIQKLVERGSTVVIVSHGLSLIGNFCSRVMCLNQGRVAGIGSAEQAVQTYMDIVSSREKICEIGKGTLIMRFLPSGFHLEQSGTVYTIARGLSVNLRKWEADFLSSEAVWTVKDLKVDEVTLHLCWGHWNLEQTWYIRIIDENTVEWIIRNGPNLHQNVDNLEIEAMVSGVYESFVLPEEIREFPKTENRGFNMEYLLAQQQPRRFMGVTNARDERRSIVLDFSQSAMNGSSMVITGGNLMPGHIVQRRFAAIPDQNDVHTEIHLMNQKELNNFYSKNKKILGIQTENLTLKIENDCLQLFLKNEMITCAPGLYVANQTHPKATQCDWEDIESEKCAHLRATYRHIPVVVVWRLQAVDNSIQWSAELEILELMNVEDFYVRMVFKSNPPDCIDYGLLNKWNQKPQSLDYHPEIPTPRTSKCSSGRFNVASGIIRYGEVPDG
jgi:ABC-type polysaccharide/polyol phosphate transport system ATPase subunit